MDMQSTISPENFQRICLNTHITALKLHNNYLFVGEGNEVQIYDLISRNVIHREIVFDNCSIHGIRSGDAQQILFFGSKSIKVCHIKEYSEKCSLMKIQSFSLNDWILDVQWLCKAEKTLDTIAAITAHNCLIFCSVLGDILQTFHCVENCILYSANIISCELNAVVVAVGTVFRKIILWSPNSNNKEDDRKETIHELSGHQGVIFSITYNETHNVICSTSDDRSLRVWKVSNVDLDDRHSFDFWQNSVIEITHVLFGHESRVWRASILNTYILSIGEDSFICIWNLQGKLLRKIKCHKGGSIWCLETGQALSTKGKNNQLEDSLFAFTGGSDGGVYVWDISNITNEESISQVSLFISDKSFDKDFPRACNLFMDDDTQNIIASSDMGRISLYNIKLQTWQNIFHDKAFNSYCTMAVSKENSYLALGNIFGDLVVINLLGYLAKTSKFKIHDKKVCSLHWVSKSSDILLSCSTEGQMTLWKVIYDEEFKIHCMHRFYLPKCKNHWWSTAALFLHPHNILIVGDRSGTISVYKHYDEVDLSILDQPIMSHRYIHGDNGVTDIQEQASFVYSAGRDGKVYQYFMLNGSLKLLHCIKVSHDLEWIGKMLFYNSHLLLLGFHTKDFVVWSTQLESAIMSVDCGGGHRSWDFCLNEKGQATYAAIKKKDIIYQQQNLHHVLEKSVFKFGISGQKFSCLTYILTKSYQITGSLSVIACGGEDNTVRIIGLTTIDESSKIISLNSLSGHLSNIRAITKKQMLEKDAFLLASVGGRSQIMIWKLISDLEGIKCEKLISELLSISDKKIKNKWKENQCAQVDPQTRLMDVSIVHAASSSCESETFIIGVACSDTYFRLYSFDINKREFLLNQIFKHGDNCMMKLASIYNKSSTSVTFYITGATDGSLKILKNETSVTNSSENILSDVCAKDLLHCHQSGVNALDVKFINGSTWMICSGGDDNSLMVAIMVLDILLPSSSDVRITAKCHKLDAHASQITGVKILNENTILSTSVDQKINVWKIDYKQSLLSASLHLSTLSLIPDIANIECWNNGNSDDWTIAVCGQGIEILNFKLSESTINFTNIESTFL